MFGLEVKAQVYIMKLLSNDSSRDNPEEQQLSVQQSAGLCAQTRRPDSLHITLHILLTYIVETSKNMSNIHKLNDTNIDTECDGRRSTLACCIYILITH